MSRKLYVGGKMHHHGWEILDAIPAPYLDHVCDPKDLSCFQENTFSEIYASHILGYLDFDSELLPVLKGWLRVLEPGGKIYVSVPDIESLAKLFLAKEKLTFDERVYVMGLVLGRKESADGHKIGFDQEILGHFLEQAGYSNIRRVASFGLFQDKSVLAFKGVAISLNMTAEKGVLSAPREQNRLSQKITAPIDYAGDKELTKALQLQQQGRLTEAEELFRKIVTTKPEHVFALCSLAIILLNSGRHEEALPLAEEAARVAPAFPQASFYLGLALQGVRRYDEALINYQRALAIKPDYIEALTNLGNLFHAMERYAEALGSFNRVLELEPENKVSILNRGVLLTQLKRNEDASEAFAKLINIDPDYEYLQGLLAFSRLHICDWSEHARLAERITSGVKQGKRICNPLAFMAISGSPEDQLQCAMVFAGHKFPKSLKPVWNGELYRHEKIRVAYISPDLREHPVGHLTAGIFEQHDKSKFEITGLSLGIDDKSRLRSRFLSCFDNFIDVRQKSAQEIALLLRSMEIDIAVDLAGYTADSRTDLFAFRGAPIQVNYLGFPGTLGTGYMDYILADRNVIPERLDHCYSEKVVCLPNCYLPAGSFPDIPGETPSRASVGLPETGFVFCSFNHDYKINPPVFDIWMRLLRKIEASVLWLMKLNDPAQRNLRREACARGVDPDRLIFATRVPLVEDHLARYRLADIFLDTSPYNAHTTASDALRVGLPVLTCRGETFPSRVAASLLQATGLPELITNSLEEYETMAIRLATDTPFLREIRKRLELQRDSHPFFKSAVFCRYLEDAYTAMWERWQRGEAPAGFAVKT